MLKMSVVAQRVPYPPNKGEKLRTYHQIARLVQLGYGVTVHALQDNEQDIANAKALSKTLGIDVHTYPLKAKWRRYLWSLARGQALSVGAFYSKGLQAKVNDLLKGQEDVVLFSASSLSYYVFSGADREGSPHLLMDFMDVDSDKWAQYASMASFPMSWVYRRESAKIKALEIKTNQQFVQTFLIANEEVTLFHNKVCHHKDVKVLGNGLDFKRFYPANTEERNSAENFLFTGVMDYKPNIDAVCWFVEHCWPAIKTHMPQATFTIAGMNPSEKIKALAKDKSIQVTGFVDDILPYFHKATAFVAPFRIARGVQNKVLQASACALPIITTSMGAEGISFASEQTMYLANTDEEFIASCIDVVNNPAGANQKAQQGYTAIREAYSWEQQLKPLEDTLASL
ncbi:TIGR03087 family PEP-CTERM/XrtA system glycosyltransferase [Alteromonas australica]|uniref:TIGR03087 family PEP-CTERM/XrtA system glycosyltransferase n=1 Tax=Alteromonas australica TaxID=589873 RepID=UPI0009DD88FE|nr:TIGR03087 family PEP-CTERM/XrtA system glycosyltransferase [Alteromonas australica]